ncbi:hypothetical protein [Halocynthiibacter namhaensis]|uniref:hypothetical protein n=1 Tax=Halocynthiibacter namhaensis TaxID=1290553 RepID=UPI0012E005DE|nr:hypothetical protein [Halocynthiibacter namhaensis]
MPFTALGIDNCLAQLAALTKSHERFIAKLVEGAAKIGFEPLVKAAAYGRS